jgi:hypothetical protein
MDFMKKSEITFDASQHTSSQSAVWPIHSDFQGTAACDHKTLQPGMAALTSTHGNRVPLYELRHTSIAELAESDAGEAILPSQGHYSRTPCRYLQNLTKPRS